MSATRDREEWHQGSQGEERGDLDVVLFWCVLVIDLGSFCVGTVGAARGRLTGAGATGPVCDRSNPESRRHGRDRECQLEPKPHELSVREASLFGSQAQAGHGHLGFDVGGGCANGGFRTLAEVAG